MTENGVYEACGLMIIMSMGWDYESELRTPTSLLFTSQVTTMVEWYPRFVRQSYLSILPAVT
jgi:hypothetical protein